MEKASDYTSPNINYKQLETMIQLEKGEASLRVELNNGQVKVFHGTDGELLFKRLALEGDWNKIINGLKNF